ncbi:MAG: hypothetical protein ACYC3Q_01890 [Gemmatimonadaceae bacterium]
MTPFASRPAPSRAHRVRDGVAAGLLVLGAIGYLVAHRGMQSLIAHQPYERLRGPGGGWNLAIWGRYWHLSRASLVVAGIGVAVAIWSFVSHLRSPATPDGQDHRS